MEQVIAFVRDLDRHIGELAAQTGPLFPLLLFAYGFFQTGLVIGPLIPGNAVVFAVGVLASGAKLIDPWLAFSTMALGAALGNVANYGQGVAFGRHLFDLEKGFLTAKNLAKTEEFFARYGGRAMLLSPFLPFVRSFAPFVAGLARMPLGPFTVSGTVGAVVWIGALVAAGAVFGKVPGVRENIGLAVVGFSLLVVAKIVFDALRRRARRPAPLG